MATILFRFLIVINKMANILFKNRTPLENWTKGYHCNTKHAQYSNFHCIRITTETKNHLTTWPHRETLLRKSCCRFFAAALSKDRYRSWQRRSSPDRMLLPLILDLKSHSKTISRYARAIHSKISTNFLFPLKTVERGRAFSARAICTKLFS